MPRQRHPVRSGARWYLVAMHMMDRVRSAAKVTTRAPYAPTFGGAAASAAMRRPVVAAIGRRRTRARVGADAFIPGTWVDDTHFKDPKGYVWTVVTDSTSTGGGFSATSDAYIGAKAGGIDKLTLAAAIVAYSSTHEPTHPDAAKSVTWGPWDYGKRAAIVFGPPIIGMLLGPFGVAYGLIVSAGATGALLVKDVLA